jgi:hypothetical protein
MTPIITRGYTRLGIGEDGAHWTDHVHAKTFRGRDISWWCRLIPQGPPMLTSALNGGEQWFPSSF